MIMKFLYPIKELNRTTTLHIYLPDDYDGYAAAYPVMYMLDGHNLFYDEEATFGKSWGLKEFLDRYDKEFIVVGIECDHEGNNRLAEYCPYEVKNTFLGTIEGKGKIFMDWLVHDLKPYIDHHFRTYAFREATGIGGSSMGGLMAYYALIRYNKVFSKAACLSPSLILCPHELEEEAQEDWIHPDTRMYLSIGTKEFETDQEVLFAYLNHFARIASPALSSIYIVPGGMHNEKSWEEQNQAYFDYLWK